ncbi:hypothetical protein AtubIFM54640_008854 [Aspergillus tubingensis]|nr:hypothetical protein AtubIFM54640_008854 [Aspergillus tubingensis]
MDEVEFCGDTCVSNCNATAPCGKDASTPDATCPLNVCCSEWGFCGTTDDFCGTGCQGDFCGPPTVPSCSSNDVLQRVIGYYEGWANNRTCDSWSPSNLAVSGLTHINYAFATFQPTVDGWVVSPMSGVANEDEIMNDLVNLKSNHPGLSVYLSIGGWSFNDGDTASYWSDMASTADGRMSWSKSVMSTLQRYGFDGVDLDWEYPVATDRGGSSDDTFNYVYLVSTLRQVLDASGASYGITFTTPASYWYLQYFDVPGMLSAGADWTNLMTYDLHGVWDGSDPWIGKVMQAHTNLTEIKSALDLMWRVGVEPSKIVMGIGFYGRSFTVADATCLEPGCAFSDAGNAGPCTATAGVLSYKGEPSMSLPARKTIVPRTYANGKGPLEIVEYMADGDAVVYLDNADAVNYMIWDSATQWVSFDTNVTFQQKIAYANEVCLGGLMIWSLDQDTYDWKALSGLLGKEIASGDLLTGGSMSEETAQDLASLYSAYTGTDCYVSECVDWNTGQCKSGYSVLEYVHSASLGMIQDPDKKLCNLGTEGQSDAQYRLICCPTDAMPEGCRWEGGSEDGSCTGGGTCGKGKYELVADSYTDRTGFGFCLSGKRSLCCNTDPALEKCSWTTCGNTCASDMYTFDMETPYEGTICFYLALILSKTREYDTDTYKNCQWYGCNDSCPKSKVLITQRTEIDSSSIEGDWSYCTSGTNKLCCDPPSGANSWPVDPADLFKYPDEDDVSYYYSIEKTSNDDATNDDSTDPFAFVMIDGDTSAYDESLVDQWTFLTDEQELSKRHLKNHRRSSIFESRNDTFENVVETYHIQCIDLFVNGSNCNSLFEGGASNTIVKMPKDLGAGPYARVISLVPLRYQSKSSNIKARSTTEVYELTVDYDLAAASAEAKGDVNFRVDYTNLLEYWKEITDSPNSKKRKRWFGAYDDWLQKITTIVKDEKGYLPLDYVDTIKLFHAHATCPKTNIDATFDIDADIKLALQAQYGYYFEGAILPTPKLISAYGYFSIEPTAAILMTLRAEAVMQSNASAVELFSAGFPGLSIKGLISIGPELALTGQMQASLQVSGELNAGVSLSWARTEVYFPQDVAGKKASVAPADLHPDNDQVYSFEPTFDASLTAQGNLALSLTPEVKFGISVLGGNLMSGYVTAGMTNTIQLGVNASASISGDGSTSAGFCYWADFIYSIFIEAETSFLDGAAYWGDKYDVVSPSDPLALVEETCIKYVSSDPLSKREAVEALVSNSTGQACFGGIIACNTVEDSRTTAGNMSCPYLCDADGASCTILDGTSHLLNKRATTGQCMHYPAMYINCDWFQNKNIPNLDTSTQAAMPYYMALGAQRVAIPARPGPRLTSVSKSKGHSGPLRSSKLELTQQGCKGGVNLCFAMNFRSAACSPWEQQSYQSYITRMIPHVIDRTNNNLRWGTEPWAGVLDRMFTINLFDSNNNPSGTFLGTYGGYLAGNQNLIRARIAGGINTFGSEDNKQSIYYLSKKVNNALCHIDGTNTLDSSAMGVWYIKLYVCKVVYGDSTGADLLRRDGGDGDDDSYTGRPEMHPRFWRVKELRIPKDYHNHVVLTRRDDPDGLAQVLAQSGDEESGGWDWDDTDSIALTLLDDNDGITTENISGGIHMDITEEEAAVTY